ncbi:MAG: LysR substrate-binding domain-containing protein [Actinomycetota bacterium]|jgi:LysR family hydrogen peroxide-inducible transcriptional activator
MDLRQLSALVAIADHGSFSSAARALYTVQSNVSGHISRLEKELGVTLVDRHRGGLTDDGGQVVERARRILREMDDISADMASRGDAVSGDARIGVIGTTARWLMPQLLPALAEQHPLVHVTVFEGSSTTLLPRLMAGHLDAAVVHLPVDDPELTVEPLFAEDLIIIVHSRHPWAQEDELSLQRVASEQLLIPPKGTAMRRILDKAAAASGVTLRAQAEIDGVRLLTSLAMEGFGPAIVPSTAVPGWVKGDFKRVLVPELPRRVIGWVQRRRPTPGAPTRAVHQSTREILGTRGALQRGVHVGSEAFPLGKNG